MTHDCEVTDTQGQVLTMKGDIRVEVQDYVGVPVQILAICTEWEACRALLSICLRFSGALSPDARTEDAWSQEVTDTP